jgi:hypothetical protein
LSWYHERISLYTTAWNDQRRVSPSFSPSCPSLSYHG